MTPYEKMFTKINTDIKVPIRVGNGAVMMSKGKGDIEVMTKKGKRIIKDVFLVPKLGKNLLSVPQMITNGYRVKFKGKSASFLIDWEEILVKFRWKTGVFT